MSVAFALREARGTVLLEYALCKSDPRYGLVEDLVRKNRRLQDFVETARRQYMAVGGTAVARRARAGRWSAFFDDISSRLTVIRSETLDVLVEAFGHAFYIHTGAAVTYPGTLVDRCYVATPDGAVAPCDADRVRRWITDDLLDRPPDAARMRRVCREVLGMDVAAVRTATLCARLQAQCTAREPAA